jgi:hypothetical protein
MTINIICEYMLMSSFSINSFIYISLGKLIYRAKIYKNKQLGAYSSIEESQLKWIERSN